MTSFRLTPSMVEPLPPGRLKAGSVSGLQAAYVIETLGKMAAAAAIGGIVKAPVPKVPKILTAPAAPLGSAKPPASAKAFPTTAPRTGPVLGSAAVAPPSKSMLPGITPPPAPGNFKADTLSASAGSAVASGNALSEGASKSGPT